MLRNGFWYRDAKGFCELAVLNPKPYSPFRFKQSRSNLQGLMVSTLLRLMI